MHLTQRIEKPQSVLFLCEMNAVRSPMAEALCRFIAGKSLYIASAGVRKGERDPFVTAVMEELALDLERHAPQTLEDLEEMEGLNFDLIITLSPVAHHCALELTRTLAAEVEYWPTPDPSLATGNREQQLDAYREVRDLLKNRIIQRFRPRQSNNE